MAKKSKRLDPIVKAERAAERKRKSDEKKAEKARLRAAAKALKIASKSISFLHNAAVPFTSVELLTIGQHRDRMTGPTEEAVALATGQSIDENLIHENDLPDGGEVKHIQTKNPKGKPVSTLGTFRGDIRCIERWSLVLLTLGALVFGSDEPDEKKVELAMKLSKGLTGKWNEELPKEIADVIHDYMQPSVALASYDKYIVLTTFTHWLKVTPDQYDQAFQLATVSNGDVKWRVRREWLHSLSSLNPPLEKEEPEEEE